MGGTLTFDQFTYIAGPGCSDLSLKQMHGCSEGCTCSGARRQGICSSTILLYPTRGQWLPPYRGHDVEENSFPPPSTQLSSGCGFKYHDCKNFFSTTFNCSHKGMISMLMLTFLSHYLPKQLACCHQDPSFMLLLHPLESLSKLYVIPTTLPTIFSVYPELTSPVWVISQDDRAFWIPKVPTKTLFAIILPALPSLYFDLLLYWVGYS